MGQFSAFVDRQGYGRNARRKRPSAALAPRHGPRCRAAINAMTNASPAQKSVN
jgi:hypothetical protein